MDSSGLACTQPAGSLHHTAILQGERSLTYKELDRQSSDVAKGLKRYGVHEGDRVVVLASRCIEVPVLFIGILKVGACYVPLDADSLSAERISQTINRVCPALAITCGYHTPCGGVFIEYDHVLRSGAQLPDDSLARVRYDPESLAYIIFTSGTTSRPKGVMVPRRALLNYVQQGSPETPFNMQITDHDTVLSIFSPAFDACTGVIFSTLYNGGTLLMSCPETLQSDIMECTVLPCTPSILRTISSNSSYPQLRAIFLGGEAPSHDLIRFWATPRRAIFNCYGPSETTCASLIAKLHPSGPIHLGIPMRNSEVLMMKDGIPASQGEIWISGPGLALGYLDEPAKTAAKFVQYRGTRYYRTGDFAKKKDGHMYFMGREDSIVKNRGFLINLETEVMPALLSNDKVKSAFALHHEEKLCGFVTPTSCSPGSIRASMQGSFDSFLVPDIIIAIDELPMTQNGKVDQARLRDLVKVEHYLPRPRKRRRYTPSNDNLRILICAVQESLDLKHIDIDGTASFIGLGGNSLSAIRLLSYLHMRRLTLSLTSLLSGNNLLAISKQLSPTVASNVMEKVVELGSESPLSDLQLQLLGSMTADPTLYYMLVKLQFMGDVAREEGRLKSAWETIFRRHAILRSTFDVANETSTIQGEYELEWQDRTCGHLGMSVQCEEEANSLWTLAKRLETINPVTAFRFIHADNQPSQLLWLVHHSRVDGHSVQVLLAELHALLAGATLPEVQDFRAARSIQKRLSDEPSEEANFFWDSIEAMSSEAEPISLPKPDHANDKSHIPQVVVSPSITLRDAESACTNHGLSLSALIYAAWSRVISTCTNASTCSFGVVLSGRILPLERADTVVGPMINVCPFPVRPLGSGDLGSWLLEIHLQTLRMTENQWSMPSRQKSRTSYQNFDTLVSIQYGIEDLKERAGDTFIKWQATSNQQSACAWTLLVEQDAGALVFRLLHRPALVSRNISEQAVMQFNAAFVALLDTLRNSVDLSKSSFSWPPHAEHDKLIQSDRSIMVAPDGKNTSLQTAFETAVFEHRDLVALEWPGHSMTYGELDSAANVLATRIMSHNYNRSPIAILADGSINWIVAILATVKSGRPYCAIDMHLPLERIQHMMHVLEARLLLVPSNIHVDPPDFREQAMRYDITELTESTTCKEPLPTMKTPQDVAYFTFTSGTTGTPKCIAITDDRLLSYISYPPARLHAKPGTRIAQTFSIGFDACAAEIFGALCYGATLVLKSPTDILYALRRATAAMVTPSLLQSLDPEEFRNLETLLLGGERVSQDLANRWAPRRRLYNGYGPCECTIGAVFKRLLPDLPVTLGLPIPGMRAYVLHQDLSLAPVGVRGEIYLSGVQVANGYHASESLEQGRFSENPWQPGQRMFRTGDYGRWNENFELEFLGRADRQVKLDGYRINLEEVEVLLLRCDPNITRACVLIKEERMVAFICGQGLDTGVVMAAMRSTAPHYYVPHSCQIIKKVPLTSNQKADYRALEELVVQPFTHGALCGPQSPTERAVAGIWRDVLNFGERTIGATDDFISLGGHSVLQLRLAKRLSQHFDFHIPLSLVVKHSSFADQAHAIDWLTARSNQDPAATASESLSFMEWFSTTNTSPHESLVSLYEQDMLTISSKLTQPAAFTVSFVFRATGPLIIDCLATSIQEVLQRNRILRTCFAGHSSATRRTISPSAFSLALEEGPEPSMQRFDQLAAIPFDLEKEQLIRVMLHVVDQDSFLLGIQAHHAIMDAPGLHTFLHQLSRLYAQAAGPELPPPLPHVVEVPDALDYIAWQSSQLPGEETTHFWQDYLASPPPSLFTLPIQSAPLDNAACSLKFSLPPIHPSGAPGNMQETLLTVFLLALATVLKREDLIISIPFSHRREPGTESLAGSFLDRLPIRMRLENRDSDEKGLFEQAYQSVKKDVRNASRHALPFRRILEMARVKDEEEGDDGAEHNMFDCCEAVFTFHRAGEKIDLALEGCEVEFVAQVKPDSAMFPLLLEVYEMADGGFECEVRWMREVVGGDVVDGLVREMEGRGRVL